MTMRWLAALAAATTLAAPTAHAQDEADDGFAAPEREIVHLEGDLYRAREGNWYAIFLVTEAGIILGDPLNTRFAEWLSTELDRRFDVPVRYVVYSHSHFDHAAGGAAFAETAQFVAHEHMARNMDGRYPHMPGDMVDRGNDGVFDREDIMIPTEARPGVCGFSPVFFDMFDADGDGEITPEELQADIVPPDVLYSERMTLKLGGQRVELIHPGLNHSDDATIMYFPEERVVFATEFLADALVTDDIRSLPSACGPFDGTPLDEWIASYRTVEQLEFDIVAPGHGDVFGPEGVTATREYFEDLKNAVSNAMAEGVPLEEMKRTLELEEYSDWENYERLLPANIEAAYENLKLYR